MSHGPPDLPIHLVPPLGGLLSTRGGHGKELQPCFTIREDLTDRTDASTWQDGLVAILRNALCKDTGRKYRPLFSLLLFSLAKSWTRLEELRLSLIHI